jgi:hypothetical protein
MSISLIIFGAFMVLAVAALIFYTMRSSRLEARKWKDMK